VIVRLSRRCGQIWIDGDDTPGTQRLERQRLRYERPSSVHADLDGQIIRRSTIKSASKNPLRIGQPPPKSTGTSSIALAIVAARPSGRRLP
jgi:hypothetical protein